VKIGHIQNRILWFINIVLKINVQSALQEGFLFKKKKNYRIRITLRVMIVFPVRHVFEQKTGHVQALKY